MKTYPPLPVSGFITLDSLKEWLLTISKLRGDDVSEIRSLNSRFVRGRLRDDRTVPASNSDVAAGVDKEGDIVRSATYEYLLVNDAGTLKWARHVIDVTW